MWHASDYQFVRWKLIEHVGNKIHLPLTETALVLGQIGLPWYNIGGNHDLNYEAPSAKYSRETFKRIYGPAYYAFEYGGALFLMLDICASRLKIWLVHAVIGGCPGALVVLFGQEFGCRIRSE